MYEVLHPRGHNNPLNGLIIAGNLVPWNGTICITPKDLVQTVEDQVVCENEGSYGRPSNCTLDRLLVEYEDENNSIFPVRDNLSDNRFLLRSAERTQV